ncbi:MAG: hypothetical protein AAF726_19015 [Planctomycetota bacterium]
MLRRSQTTPLLASALAPLPVVLAALALDGTDLATRYSTDRAFTVAVETTSTTEVLSRELLRDGEPVDRGGRGGGGDSSRTVSYEYTDTPLEAEDGRPSQVRRAFGSIGGATSFEMRGEEIERAVESAFEDLVVVLTDDDGDVEIEVVDGSGPDDESRLDGHRLTLPLDALAPPDEVEVGDSWDLEDGALSAALGLDVAAKLIDRPERPEGGEGRGRGGRGQGGGGGGSGSLASAEWTGTATYTDRTEDVEGLTCVVIEIDAEVEGDEELGEGSGSRTTSGRFEGELLWCLAEERPVKLEFDGEVETDTSAQFESRRGSMQMSSSQRTRMEFIVEIGAEAAESND